VVTGAFVPGAVALVGAEPAAFGCTLPPAAGRDPEAVVEGVGRVVAAVVAAVVGVAAGAGELASLDASMVVWSFDDPPQAVSPIVAAAKMAPIARCMSLSPLRARPDGALQ
jgi:hypothetical protein